MFLNTRVVAATKAVTRRSPRVSTTRFPSEVLSSRISTIESIIADARHCFSTETAREKDGDVNTQSTVTDYFALLGVQRRFHVDPKELHASYRRLMTKYHPDMLQHQRSNDEDGDASQITNAYQILRKPHTRATHLLELVGRPIEEELVNASDLVGPEFLMHVMEIREEIDSIPRVDGKGGGGNESARQLKALLEQTESEMDQVLEQLDQAFQNHELDKALELSAQLQYWNRIEETIQEKL